VGRWAKENGLFLVNVCLFYIVHDPSLCKAGVKGTCKVMEGNKAVCMPFPTIEETLSTLLYLEIYLFMKAVNLALLIMHANVSPDYPYQMIN
jgi:hypothetical protein